MELYSKIVDDFFANKYNIINNMLLDKHDIYLAYLDLYKFKIVDDSVKICEDANTTVLSISHFNKIIKSPEDIGVCYLHEQGHSVCRDLWTFIPIAKSDFKQHERDIFEEIYISRLMDGICDIYEDKYYNMYITLNSVQIEKHPQLNGMFDDMILKNYKSDIRSLQFIHDFIYANDPYDKNVFREYMSFWKDMIYTYNFRKLFKIYEFE